jgi:hypothetical protein
LHAYVGYAGLDKRLAVDRESVFRVKLFCIFLRVQEKVFAAAASRAF